MFKSLTYILVMLVLVATIPLAIMFGAMGFRNAAVKNEKQHSLKGATGWFNTRPLNFEQLKGKVVLVDFWTYTCINWRRTLPYVREWAAKYKEQGLTVIGVHTPEFSFEKEADNVTRAISDMDISFPVVSDNDFEIWNSFDNKYWPALYLIDASGRIRYQKFGEGDYAQIERQIQALLKETSANNVATEVSQVIGQGAEAAPDWEQLQSGENFLGYGSTRGFASTGKIVLNKRAEYMPPAQLQLNQWSLAGQWIMKQKGVQLYKQNGKLVYKFHARDLHLVMGSIYQGIPVKFRVLIDGKPPGNMHGVDINSDGYGKIDYPRMYQLIRQQGEIIDRVFEIEFFNNNVEVYDVTFG